MREDKELAETVCLFRGVRYLSHERYGEKLYIAVEAPGDRYEIEINAPPLTNASATADSRPLAASTPESSHASDGVGDNEGGDSHKG